MLSAKGTQGIGTKQLLDLRKPLIIEANWEKKTYFNLVGRMKIGLDVEGKRSCSQMNSVPDDCMRVKREVDKVVHPSCLVPPVQACGAGL